MNRTLQRRLQVLERQWPPQPKIDLRHEIDVQAMAKSFSPAELGKLKEQFECNGSIVFEPEMEESVRCYLELRNSMSRQLTGKLFEELT
jgi:hypothetical protein